MHVRIFLFRCLSVIALLAVAAGGTTSAHDIILGVGTHFINYPGAQPLLLNLARKVGADSVRADTGWKYVETEKGVYRIPPAWDKFVDNARQRGLKPLLILDYGNKFYDDGKLPLSHNAIEGFVRFATFVVKHFAGRVRYYEVWNEWNTGTGGYHPGGSAKDYAQLFDATYAAIKRIAPKTIVLATAGYGDWYGQIARLGVAARADGVAIHPYVRKEQGYRPSIGSNGAERSVKQVMDAEATMRRLGGGKKVPLYITEIGWPTSTGSRGYPAEDVAAMAERSLLMFASLPYVRGVWWYDLINDGPNAANPEDRFGLYRRRYAVKPAGLVIRSLAALLRHNELNWNHASNLAAGLVVLNRRGVRQPSVIAWDVHSSKTSGSRVGATYAVSCDPSLKIVRTSFTRSATDLPMNSVPTVITYHNGQCIRQPLIRR